MILTVMSRTPARRSLSTVVRGGALLGVLGLVPLLLAPGVFFYFDVTPKILVLLAGTAVALALWRGRAGDDAPARGWLRLLLAAQAGSLLVSTAFSSDPALSLTGTNWRRFGLPVHLAVLICAYLLSLERPRSILRVVAISGSLAALYGIGQYFGWDPWVPKQAYHIGEGIWTIVRPPGPLGHAGYFGVYLLSVAFAGVALVASEEPVQWRWIGAAAASLAPAAILLSGTRAASLGLMIGVVTLAIRRRPRVTARRASLMAVLAVGIVAFYFSPAGLMVRARTRWFREDPGGGGRLLLWRDTLKMARQRWVTGFGPETYSSQFPRFQSEQLARQFPERYYESPHNIFADALASQGVPGMLLLAGLAALGLWASRGAGPAGEALAAGLLASVVGNQFLSFTMPTALLFYVTITTLCSFTTSQGPSAPVPVFAILPVSVLFLTAAFFLSWADFWLARTKTALEAGEIEQAIQNYQRLRRWAPPGFDADLWYSRALLAAAPKIRSTETSRLAWQQAFDAAVRASATSEERPNAYYNLAAFYALQNDFARTEQSLRSAIAWAPQWYKPRWMLAQVLRQAGRLDEAERLARLAVELNGGKDREVSQTWNEIQAARGK